MCQNALPTQDNLAKRLSSHQMGCAICGDLCESAPHILLYCPLAHTIWRGSGVNPKLWQTEFCTMVDCIVLAHQELSMEELGMFVAILWECWNARNRFIFESIEDDVTQLSSRARRFVASYREMKDTMGVSG